MKGDERAYDFDTAQKILSSLLVRRLPPSARVRIDCVHGGQSVAMSQTILHELLLWDPAKQVLPRPAIEQL